ncbi:MAG: fused MFS/spermidine synthase [Anaerolineales bacterium]|nr:fused MFS/spermidine synthase [Anaerolineales bacterium]
MPTNNKIHINLPKISWLSAFAFFASGFSALLYQVAWQRMLNLFAGSDVRSAALVIGGFLAGLGLGNLLAGRYSDKLTSQRAMQVFALSNLAIGLYGYLSNRFFHKLLSQELFWLAESFALGFFVIFLFLLFPTLLMGISLPLISRAIVRTAKKASKQIGTLYGINTLGSVTGALVGGWLLVPRLGYGGTLLTASLISLSVGCFAFALAQVIPLTLQNKSNVESQKLAPREEEPSKSLLTWAGLVILAGYIAISMELVWFRVLSVVLYTSAYSFGHLLAFVLAGYSIGSLLATKRSSSLSPHLLYSRLLIYAILYTVISLIFFSHLGGSYNSLIMSEAFQNSSNKWVLDFIVIPSLLLLPPNIFIGYSFTILQRGIQTNLNLIGTRIGFLQFAGTIGNVLGSVLTGLVLFHYVGTIGALRVALIAGVVFVLFSLRQKVRRGIHQDHLLAGALALCLIIMPSNSGFWKELHDYKMPEYEFLELAEDSSGVSALLVGEQLTLAVNAETEGYFRYGVDSIHTTLGFLATSIHPNPENVFVLGIGSGNTPVAAGFNPATQSILAVEIVSSQKPLLESVAQGNPQHGVNTLFNDPRYSILMGDGRKILTHIDQNFDIIEADAIRPYKSGSGFLYSIEFFELARSRLKEGGYMVQWSATPRVRNTFRKVFPYIVEIPRIVLIGSMTPIEINRAVIMERLKSGLYLNGYFDEESLLVRLENLLDQLEPVPHRPNMDILRINTDLFPRDELGIPGE